MNPTTLTPSEAALVRDLLKLWDAAWDNNRCQVGCRCDLCKALESAGNHEAAVFGSLTAKVGGDK